MTGPWTLDAADLEMLARIESRSVRSGECLLWTGCITNKGYGKVNFRNVEMGVHRAAWIARNGPIPPETPFVCHRCDVRTCTAEAHLFLGTQADNIADMVAKGRHRSQAKTHCKHGHLFDAENTRISTDGSRVCRACHRADELARRAARAV